MLSIKFTVYTPENTVKETRNIITPKANSIKKFQWGARNPIDGDTCFVSFITHRSVQSFFPERL